MRKILRPVSFAFLLTVLLLIYRNQSNRSPSSTSEYNEQLLKLNTELIEAESKLQIKKFILKSWDWHFQVSSLFFNFDNLDIQTPSGRGEFCELYPYIILSFEAPNTSYSGEHSEIFVQTECQSRQKAQVNLQIDFKFLKQESELATIKSSSYNVAAPIRLQNWDNEIPLRWRLKHIVYLPSNKDPKANIEITNYEIIALLGYPIEFEISQFP